MNRNIEIKARAVCLESLEKTAVELGAWPAGLLFQTETYFESRSGRLKLRECDHRAAELIWYQRANDQRPKTSHYLRVPIPNPEALKGAISTAWEILAVVAKRRRLYLWQNVRIHLDEVEHLGAFVELEAVLQKGQDERVGQEQIQWLAARLRIAPSDFLSYSYVDLMLAESGGKV